MLNVLNIGKSGAAQIHVEGWVGNYYFADHAPFIMNPGDNERRVVCQRELNNAVPHPSNTENWEKVSIRISWMDANRTKTYSLPELAEYTKKDVMTKGKIWSITVPESTVGTPRSPMSTT